ncbi:hypothetical protein BJ138DRAFT_1171012 [Hygrophoropsis aurantiaca]|uniref:Uncharacterized protein n=1 Tax=Hygrophoropsis aurantiaca TaxID=72124 RepID=A0ACB8AKW2_9AGAM|nr:hypothetical protein BJ138DRAFT_1171012 [Hygrophoropsis aurantiaca]
MAVAIAPWSVVLEAGKKESVIPQADVHIKNAALSDELADDSGRTTIKFTYQNLASVDDDDDDDEGDDAPELLKTTVLCSLTAGKIEQSSVDIILERDEEYIFELVGKNTIHLSGNYIDQVQPDAPPFGSDDEEDSDMEEGAFNLEDVSSDVEFDADAIEMDEDAERFEEVDDVPEPKSLKRSHEAVESEAKLTKSQQKKLNKKLKAASGEAVATGVEDKAPAEDKPAQEEKKEKKADKKEKKEKKEKKAEDASASKVLAGGVKIKDVKVGTGKAAKNGDRVGMRYIGKLTDGKVFDKNTTGKPFAFKLGKGEVIKGWDVGVAGMQVGGERELTVPASMAYGSSKIPGIPPNSTLVFEVKLLEIK